MKQLLAVLWLALFALATPAAAQTFPPLTGRVVDQAHLLTPAQVDDLTSKSAALEAQSGRQFVVATVNSLEGHPVDDYAYRLGRAWGLGQKGKDDGVLLLVAPNEHKVWIATGYGSGAFMTDAMSGVITREDILPHFKQNPPDYGGGIEAGAAAIIKQMSLPPDQAAKNVAAATQAQQQRQHSGGSPLPILFWVMVIGFVVLSHFRRGAGRRYRGRHGGISPWVVLWGLNELSRGSRDSSWGGGGSSWGGGGGGWGGGGGGGGFSGGGGSFGGGGAGGSW
ncbi:TPM domain-containing protein [Sphingomonas sp.]|uniref:TPM domain-containing protein n=1 Tax=Sphingomonas sp. TaxID=28214 RepID=UPI0038A48174